MAKSMTAFARTEQQGPFGRLIWEIRSVNHRFLDLCLRLPDDLRGLEPDVRERVGARLARGKVEVSLRVQRTAAAGSPLSVDLAMLDALLEARKQVLTRVGTRTHDADPMDLLRWPGVVKEDAPDLELVRGELLGGLDMALDELTVGREREGARLRQVISDRAQAVTAQLALVRERRPQLLARLRERLIARVRELELEPDRDRLEQELVLLAQKLDVDEELERLAGHLTELAATLERGEPIGRRLDFLMQELNREANTLASKSNDAPTTQACVEIKVLIEQMREQVQNLE